jgi:hypothetical protein
MVIAMGRSKKRFSVILALGLIICVSLTACSSEPDSETDEKTTASSIYIGDSIDGSSAAGQEGWFYYRKVTYDEPTYDQDASPWQVENVKNELYRISADGTEKNKLTESDNTDDFCDITVSGDWIYYTGREEEDAPQRLYKIRPDGK